ncbi:MAG: hypothetical protein U0802_10720 [Candidatus Binatia bacterium]
MVIRAGARQRGAEAEVRAAAEGEVVVVGPGQVEAIGIGEARRIAVGGGEQAEHDRAAAQRAAAEHHVVGEHHAIGRLHRTVVAQELLHRAADQRRIVLQAAALFGMAQQGQDGVGDQVGGGFVSGAEDQPAEGQQLGAAQDVALVLDRHQGADQVVARRRPARLGDVAQIGGHVLERRLAGAQAAGGLQRVEQRRQRVRPVFEAGAVGARDAEQLGDHHHRQRIGEGGDQIHAPPRPHRLEQLVDQRLDARLQAFDHARREGLVDQPAQARVARRIDHQQRAEDHVDEGRTEAAERIEALEAGRLRPVDGEARVAQHGGDVGVARQHAAATQHRREVHRVPLEQPAVGRIGIEPIGGVERVEGAQQRVQHPHRPFPGDQRLNEAQHGLARTARSVPQARRQGAPPAAAARRLRSVHVAVHSPRGRPIRQDARHSGDRRRWRARSDRPAGAARRPPRGRVVAGRQLPDCDAAVAVNVECADRAPRAAAATH